MVEAKYAESKEKAKAEVKQMAGVSLTCDMWTSINMDAYLAATCHFGGNNTCLNSVLLGVVQFPQTRTAEHLARIKASLPQSFP